MPILMQEMHKIDSKEIAEKRKKKQNMDMSFKQTLGDSEGQRSLVCCSAWGHKELDTTEQMTSP